MRQKIKEPVRIRTKRLANGNESIYLDTYVDGRREYEFLKLYLIPERGRADKTRNEETMRLAQAIKAQRVMDIQSGRHGMPTAERRVTLISLIDKRIEQYGDTSTAGIWRGMRSKLVEFTKGKRLTLSEVTPQWVTAWRGWLSARLATNSVWSYDKCIKSIMIQAEADGAIDKSPYNRLPPCRREESKRAFLTEGELRAMADAECGNAEVKRAFLFSALTGLRVSDIRELTWGDIVAIADGREAVERRQKKTRGMVRVELTQSARALLGERGEDRDKVFASLPSSPTNIRKHVAAWAERAGVGKHVTFHVARHTFATLLLTKGADIYTVSKLLGHSGVGVTEVYAKVIDEKRLGAVDRLPEL